MAMLKMTGMPGAPHGMNGEWWCLACCVLAKGAIFKDDAVQRRVQEKLTDKNLEFVTVGPKNTTDVLKQLEEAVTWGPHPLAGGQVVPLCWTHAPAADGTAPPAEPPRQQLLRGMS